MLVLTKINIQANFLGNAAQGAYLHAEPSPNNFEAFDSRFEDTHWLPPGADSSVSSGRLYSFLSCSLGQESAEYLKAIYAGEALRTGLLMRAYHASGLIMEG